MSLRELSRIGSAFSLVRDGMSSKSRRDLAYPRSWGGLSISDLGLLVAHVGRSTPEITELHTDVQIGSVPADSGEWATEWHRKTWRSIHPLRIDAVAWSGRSWTIIEIKPDAGYVALGQLLCYRFWANKCLECLRGSKLAVVTDKVQSVVEPVFISFGIQVFEYTDVLSER